MSTASSKKYKLIGLLFLALYVITHLGFYKTYFIHFPSFEKFQLLHHVHGFLMSTWILMLVTQPLLIGYGKVKLHHFVGGLSYVIAPLLVVSLFLITKMSYNKGVLLSSPRDAIADQALSIAQLFTFTGFYALAMAYRKNAARHMRYIIGTGLLMILPGLNRLLGSFYNTDFNLALVISSVLTIGIAVALLIVDIIKKKEVTPYTLILVVYIGVFLLYELRYSTAYQTLGNFIARTVF